MSNLTGTLQTVSPNDRIVQPVEMPNAFGAAAELFGSGLATVAGVVAEDKAAKARGAATAAEAHKNDVNNDAVFVRLAGEYPGVKVPPRVQQVLDSLTTAQAAEDQGRVPVGTYKTKTEQITVAYLQAHPEDADVFYAALNKNGHSTPLSRLHEADQKVKAEDTIGEAATARRVELAKTASEAGFTGTQEELETLGLTINKVKTETAHAKELLEQSRATANYNAELSATLETKGTAELIKGVHTEATMYFNNLLTPLRNLAMQAGGDVNKMTSESMVKMSQEVFPLINNYINDAILKAVSNNLPPKEIPALRAELEAAYLKPTQDLLRGDGSTFAAATRSANALANKVKIDNASALQLWSRINTLTGGKAAEAITFEVPASVVALAESEAKGYLNGDYLNKQAAAANFYAMFTTGNAAFVSMSPEAQKVAFSTTLPALNKLTSILAASPADPTDRSTTSWINASAVVVNAAVDMQPTAMSNSSATVATGSFATPQWRRVLGTAMKNDDYKEEATALVTVSRAASQRIIQGLSGNTPDPYYSIKFNTTTGIFESKYDEAKFRADNPATGRGSNFGIGFINTPSKTNTDAAVKALNDNLTHLMETTPYDKTIPANIPPVKLRALYATGKSFSDAKGAPVLTADEVWNNNAAALERQIHKAAQNPHPAGADLTTAVGVTAPGGEVPVNPKIDTSNPHYGTVVSAAEKYGVPVGIALNQIQQESGFDPNADSGKALGIAQWTAPTAKARGVNPLDPVDAINGTMKYLAELKDKFGTWEDALSIYHSGVPLAKALAQRRTDGNMTTADYVKKIMGG